MINNLNLNSNLGSLTSNVSAEADLLQLVGQNPEQNVEADIASLLDLSSESEIVSFDELLSDKSQKNDSAEEKIIESLAQTITDFDSFKSADAISSISSNKGELNKLVQRLETLIGESNQKNEKVLKALKESSELKKSLTKLIESNVDSLKGMKNLKELTKLMVKDASTPFNSNTVNEKIDNKLAINKMLGLSSKEILKSRENKEITKLAVKKNPYSKLAVKKMVSPLSQKSDLDLKSKNKNELNNDSKIITSNTNNEPLNLEEPKFMNSLKIDSLNTVSTKTSSPSKVFNLEQSLNNVDNVDTVINKIQDYIIQSKYSKEQNIQMTFNHQDFGDINLKVTKLDGENLGVNIAMNNSEAVKFFTENKVELLQTLANSGVSISDFKIETQTSGQTKDFNSSDQSFADSKSDFSGSKKGQEDKESRRRQELWELLEGEHA